MTISTEAIRGINNVNVLTDRVKKRNDECIGTPLWISSRRAKSYMESWKTSGSEANNVRWALAIARVLDESSIVIRDGELIVGSETRYVRGAEITPDQNPDDILKQMESKNVVSMSEVMFANMEPEEEKVAKEAALYWKNNSVLDIVRTQRLRQNGPDYWKLMGDGVRVFTDTVGVTSKNQAIFNPIVLRMGLNGIIERAKNEKDAVNKSWCTFPPNPRELYHKTAVLDGIIIVCEAVIRYAKKHAELAREMAGKESDPTRKKELLDIAERCEWVPANPARNFTEALQSFWFCSLTYKKESPFPAGSCPGLLDRWLYPFLKKGLEDGSLTYQLAAETLGCLWVKLNEAQCFHGFFFSKESSGSLLQQVTIGGMNPDGTDATNEASYLILEVSRQLKTPQPGIYVRWHAGIDYNFLVKCVETNRDTGGGIPAFLNDQAAVRNYLGIGVKWADAYNWMAAGCLSYALGWVNSVSRMPVYLNIPKILEITLNNGVDPGTGFKAGIPTGDVTTFTSLEQLEGAFWKQYDYLIDKGINEMYPAFEAKNERLCAPFSTALLEDNWKIGKDAMESGRYPQLMICLGHRGFVDAADALAAVDHVVFKTKKVTMARLLEALKANWVGYEDVLQLCKKAPKFGNDDDYVDDIFNRLSLKSGDIVDNKRQPGGAIWKVSRPALTGHYFYGEKVGALPDGRKAGTPLYDAGLSPGAGSDVNGPTATIRSATKVIHFRPNIDSVVMNMKLSAAVLKDRESIEKFITLLRTFFNRGGWHIQFNILNREDLVQAKAHPEQWKNLIVRVAGYSAYFVELPPAVQDEIIARTEHAL
jgi:trans-4-hydroxy-L-proline dehydratase